MKLEEVIKTTRFRDSVHKASLNILYTSYWMGYHMSGKMKELGLTSEQFNVMRILKGKHPEAMCVKDIAGRMIERSSNVPRIIDRLENKEWVKRTISKEDRRETLISLTDAGIKTLDAANTAVEKVYADIIGITNEEADQLNQLLEKLRKVD